VTRRRPGAAAVTRALAVTSIVVTLTLLTTSVRAGATYETAAGNAPVCGSTAPGFVHCFVVPAPMAANAGAQTADSAGYGPADLQSAYRLPSSRGAGQTIAVVDAMDDPTAEGDLAVYRSNYGLAPCTTSNGCFHKVNELGQAGPYPAADQGWSLEVSLDLDMVSAVCPLCNLLLVEAASSHVSDLGIAVDTAARWGASAISNSYGVQEFSGMQYYAPHYHHSGTTILVATGDGGYSAPAFPAVLSTVISVGGTTLVRSATLRGWTEKAWSASSSGCSAYVAKPSWQLDAGCSHRTVADLSAVADPAHGLAVYDTAFSSGFEGLTPGWITLGGTSASAPILAGVVGLAGNGKAMTPHFPYLHRSNFYDIKSGSNGSCGAIYLCSGVAGYDGPTGLGTPHGYGGL